jgi:hypothetical protein
MRHFQFPHDWGHDLVNQYIDATEPVLGRLDGGINLVLLGNI